jgi:hypothetical protein
LIELNRHDIWWLQERDLKAAVKIFERTKLTAHAEQSVKEEVGDRARCTPASHARV